MVTRKKRCRLICLTLPQMNRTPKTTETATPSRVPVKLRSSVELRVTAERMRTVSTPIAKDEKEDEEKESYFGDAFGAGVAGDLLFDGAAHCARTLCMYHRSC